MHTNSVARQLDMAACKGVRSTAATVVASSMQNVSAMQRVVEQRRREDNSIACTSAGVEDDIEVDEREVYFLIMHFLSSGPCQRASIQLWNELLQYKLLPRRYHPWYSRAGLQSGDEDDDGSSFPLSYIQVVERYPEIEKNHLVRLLRQQLVNSRRAVTTLEPPNSKIPTAADIPTLLGLGQFSLLDSEQVKGSKVTPRWMLRLRWPHWHSDQVHAVVLRELGGGFARHHRSPSIRAASYAVAKPSVLADRVQIIKKFRGHRNAVYCAIFDRSGQYVITGSDDRLVKIWSAETGFCLRSCRGHEGDITDFAVSSGNALVASASNDCTIRVWHLPDGQPASVLRGHTGAVTAIAFSPRQGCEHHLLSSSDDGTCRIWDARDSSVNSRVYMPKPDTSCTSAKANCPTQLAPVAGNQILCCAFNADGSTFVTGSSDRLARVWDARKWNDEITGKPNHELDVLKGHENDVNYVQFSGCAGPVKPFPADTAKDERPSKFKNSWFAHESIVTCSRDGSAIIWTRRSRRSHARSARWVKAYHLRVPPPPMPPQPPRGGGPRQRLLPTPRGVNMIVWSLDNRFVLAAIMDCRICVWNAVDGSLVHSLTGHVKSTYVLDVHPFNPRIAMSAGYDGRVIIWDIWEGRPVRVYETGEFNLVDGNFSPDGTSIVVSDEVGQIYLLATGQGESQKYAKYDQFFLGDFRPLVRDAQGNVIDQETQLAPDRRNIQDLLCDANMIPYSEPYQSMYQQRRLGALGIDWQPPSIFLAVGAMDDVVYAGIGENSFAFNLGIGGSLGDVDRHQLDGSMRWVEQPTDIDEALDWDQEPARLSDDSGSDYTASEVSLSDIDDEVSASSTEESTNSEEEVAESKDESTEENYLRRSNRNKRKTEEVTFPTSGRRVRRREDASQETCEDSVDVTDRRSARRRQGPSSSVARPATQQKSTRPKRLAAKNALQLFSHFSTHEEDDEEHVSTQPDRSFGSSERMYESDKSLQSNVPTDGSDGEKIPEEDPEEEYKLERDLSTKFEPSELGEFSRRPRSQRRHILNLQNSGTRTSDSHSKGCQEDQVDVLPVGVQPFVRAEGSEVVAQIPLSIDRVPRPLKRVIIRHPRISAPVCHEGSEGLSDIGDAGGDSNDIVNEVEALKVSHSDELPSPEPYEMLPNEVNKRWVCQKIPTANRETAGSRHGTLDPLYAIHDNVSCSSDRSASNYKESQDALGKSRQVSFKKSFLRGTSCNVESRIVDKSSGLGSLRAFAEGNDPPRPRFEDRKLLGRECLESTSETKAYQNCMEEKPLYLRALKWPPDPLDFHPHDGIGNRQVITRSGSSGRRSMRGNSKEVLSGQKAINRMIDIQGGVGTNGNFSGKQEHLEEGMMLQMRGIHDGSTSKPMVNGSANIGINKGRMKNKGFVIEHFQGKLEDHEEASFSQPYDSGGGNTSLLNRFSKKSEICTRGTSKQKSAADDCEEDYGLLKTDDANGIFQAATIVGEHIRPDVSAGNSQNDFLQDNESWSESESDKGSAKDGQNSKHNKRRTLGELHLHPMLGSTSSMQHTTGEDFISKRRIRNMRSVMSEGGREGALKGGRERKMPLTKGNEILEMSSKRKRTQVEHNPWLDSDGRGRRFLAKNKHDTDDEHARTHCRETSAESDKLRATELHGPEEDDMPFLNERRGLRASSRVRRDRSRRETSWDRDQGRFSDLHSLSRERAIRSRKSAAWLMLSEVDGTRYIPQFGDKVTYLRQGHQEFLESHQKYEPGPWTMYKNLIQAVEFCCVTELDYAILSDSGDTFCRITLEFSDQTSRVYGKSFRLSLPELTNFPDFLVEKNRYDAAIHRNWTSRDRCQVWWRSEDGKGGSWWDGRVTSVKPKSPDFPDSPWERFVVQYRGDTSGPQTHSPWELFDSKCPKWEPPHIDEVTKTRLSSVLDKLESSTDEPEDSFGIRRLRQLACRSDYINRVPLPLTLDIMKARLEKDYYRSSEALSFDVHVLATNAERYFGTASEMAHKMGRVAQCLLESLP